jgi:hypothetical protein
MPKPEKKFAPSRLARAVAVLPPAPVPSHETYDEKIIRAYKDASASNGGKGASAAEVTDLLFQRGELSKLDSCVDIADLMRALRNKGRL